MKGLYISDTELLSLANNTTLGKESIQLERIPQPEGKPLVYCAVSIIIAVLFSQIQSASSFAAVIAGLGVLFGCYWAYKKYVFNKALNRYKWITWMFTGIGMVFRGEIQDAKAHFANGWGSRDENIQCLKQTCIEMIVQRISNCNQPCGIYNNTWALNNIIILNDVLCALGDSSFSEKASKCTQLLRLLSEYCMNGNYLVDSSNYGHIRSNNSNNRRSFAKEDTILNKICLLEEQFNKTNNDPLLITEIDVIEILDTLYSAAYANPPISSSVYNRIQKLSVNAYGSVYDVLNPDAMLAHLIRCKQLSIDRVNREINETRKWVETFIKQHSGNTDFDASSYVYNFCGALKMLQLYDLERACLETAEKNIGILNSELTARLDYLSRGGGRKNDKAYYYNEQKRSDTLPVDYDAAKMNASDIEWLFNEVLGARGNNGFIDYGLAYKVQMKRVTLPSVSIPIQGKKIASAIQAKLGPDARISNVMVMALNSNDIFHCLKVRTNRFPFMAFLLDMTKDNSEIRIRLAACWVPINSALQQQKQECLSLWNQGVSGVLNYMDNIFSAMESDIQRSIDQWNVSLSRHAPPPDVKPSHGSVVYY